MTRPPTVEQEEPRLEPRQPLRVVLHPGAPSGLLERLDRREDLEVIAPGEPAGVADALGDGVPVLVTAAWEDRFLQPNLRWIASLSAGYEQYPITDLDAAGTVVTTARGVHTSSVAEHALALALALTRRVSESVRDAAVRRWEPRQAFDLAGSSAVVVGLGTIGERIAELCKAFGMHVTGVKRDPDHYEGRADRVVGIEALRDACAGADLLFSALPGGDSTRHLIGANELAALGQGWFVSVGRGSAVDEQALVCALLKGEMRGAGLDVFDVEPLPPRSPLWDMDNVVLTPHVAGAGTTYVAHWMALFADNLDAFHGVGPWRNRLLSDGSTS